MTCFHQRKLKSFFKAESICNYDRWWFSNLVEIQQWHFDVLEIIDVGVILYFKLCSPFSLVLHNRNSLQGHLFLQFSFCKQLYIINKNLLAMENFLFYNRKFFCVFILEKVWWAINVYWCILYHIAYIICLSWQIVLFQANIYCI